MDDKVVKLIFPPLGQKVSNCPPTFSYTLLVNWTKGFNQIVNKMKFYVYYPVVSTPNFSHNPSVETILDAKA